MVEEGAVLSRGTLVEIIAWHAKELADRPFWVDDHVANLRRVLALFLVGLYVGRRKILEDVLNHRGLIRNVLWWGLGLGLTGTFGYLALELWPDPTSPYATHLVGKVFWSFGTPALCFFYVALITLLTERGVWKNLLAPFAWVGQMALTNYLLQTLFLTTIFWGYGLGLYGKVRPAAGVALTLAVFVLQMLLSAWWLSRFRFGPAEWVWRTLTYGRAQPMRVLGA